jgi:hypothetical protein
VTVTAHIDSQHDAGRGPAGGRPQGAGLLLTAALLLLLGGLLALALGGCGEEEPTAETSFGEQLAAAERGEDGTTTPASFISLCANCHDRLDPAPGDTTADWRLDRKLVFNHAAHFARGIRCEACHQEFPHKPGETQHVPVETCFTCHGSVHGQQGVMAPTDCDACHTQDIEPVTPEHESPTWLLAGGEALADHSQAAQASPNRLLYCKMCHEATFCQDCHGMEIPHPDDWQGTHKETAQADDSKCMMCHESKSTCNDCHHQSFPTLADWSGDHRQVATTVGAESCFECHEPPFCSACHIQTSKQRGILGG